MKCNICRLCCILLCAALITTVVSSCSQEVSNPADPGVSVGTTVSTPQALGDVFLNSNLKIRSVLTDSSVSPVREITVELYVDAAGNGEGMLGFGDIVCDVKVVRDVLYVIVDDNIVVSVSDISGRMISATEDLTGVTDLTSSGFKVVNGVPIEYNAKIGNMIMSTTFAQSTNTFEAATLAADNVKSFSETIDYIVDYRADLASTVDAPDSEKDVESFYLESQYGITIEGKVYSVGDTCNPSTYFDGRTPEGLLTSSAYKEDSRVDFLHASYISDTGRTSFTLTSNYVQAIETTTQFEWLGLYQGMDHKELQYVLGYRLSKKDQEGWIPLDENLVVTNNRNNTFYCEVGALKVELRYTTQTGLQSIYIERPLDYVPK